MEKNAGFWERFDELRAINRTSVRQIAEELHIRESSLQSTRIYKTLPKLPWIYALAKYFGTTVEYLYTGEREDWEDNEVFRKMASDQRYMDICTRLMTATDIEIEMCMRVLDIKKDTSHATAGASA